MARDRSHLEPPVSGSAVGDSEPETAEVARTIALRLLTAAPRSRAQLREKLLAKDVPADVADRLLDRFEEVGLLDDAEYAAMLVRTRQSERGLARRALAAELARKGVDTETAQAALEQVDPSDEEAAARRLLAKKVSSTRGVEPEKRRRRLVAMLGRKGYPASMTFRLVDEAMGDHDDPSS